MEGEHLFMRYKPRFKVIEKNFEQGILKFEYPRSPT
jgi:hypothetical protein